MIGISLKAILKAKSETRLTRLGHITNSQIVIFYPIIDILLVENIHKRIENQTRNHHLMQKRELPCVMSRLPVEPGSF